MSSLFGEYGISQRKNPFSPFQDAIDPQFRNDPNAGPTPDQQMAVGSNPHAPPTMPYDPVADRPPGPGGAANPHAPAADQSAGPAVAPDSGVHGPATDQAPHQFNIFETHGLKPPRTYMTNDPEVAKNMGPVDRLDGAQRWKMAQQMTAQDARRAMTELESVQEGPRKVVQLPDGSYSPVGTDVWSRYGVRPPDTYPFNAALANRDLRRAELELQAHSGSTHVETLKDPSSGAWRRMNVFQPHMGGAPTSTDLGEAPDPEMRWLNRSQNAEGELVRMIADPKTDPDTKAWAQGQLDQSRRFQEPSVHAPNVPRPYPDQLIQELGPDGKPTGRSYWENPETHKQTPATSPGGAGGASRTLPSAARQPSEGAAAIAGARAREVTRRIDNGEDETTIGKAMDIWDRQNDPAVAAGRRDAAAAPALQAASQKAALIKAAPMIGPGRPGGPGAARGAVTAQPGNARPDALPRDQFVQNFKARRGRAPTDDELSRATAQGYIQQ